MHTSLPFCSRRFSGFWIVAFCRILYFWINFDMLILQVGTNYTTRLHVIKNSFGVSRVTHGSWSETHLIDRRRSTTAFPATLIKKKTKFSSNMRKFRRYRVQSHIWGRAWGNAQIFNHIWGLRRPLVIYDFATDPI